MKINSGFKTRSLAAVLLAFTLLCGCADKGGKTSEATAGKDTSLTASTQAEPVTDDNMYTEPISGYIEKQ